MRMRALLVASLTFLLGACSSTPERAVERVEGNVTFRLGAKADSLEVRVESSFYPTSGYELKARVEGSGEDLGSGITIVLEGVLVPLEKTGDRAPASTVLTIPLAKPLDGAGWPLAIKMVVSEDTARTDFYQVSHTAAGWKVSPGQGGFSRFEAQGSY